MSAGGITFSPLLPLPLVLLAAGLAVLALLAAAAVRRPRGAACAALLLRVLAVAVIAAALSGPERLERQEERLADRVVLLVDHSRSMEIGGRNAQLRNTVDRFAEEAARLGVAVTTAPFDDRAVSAGEALRRARLGMDARTLSAVVLISDGLIQDPAELARMMPAKVPLHLLITGDRGLTDRRLVIESAPRFAVVGRPVEIAVRVESHGVPDQDPVSVVLTGADGKETTRKVVPGERARLTVTPTHRGRMWLHLATPALPGEPVRANNARDLAIEAVRDRLRVLLISGEPHPGERTWREVLKADPAVDLVHFTILRLAESQETAGPGELSLIPFPTERLFGEELSGFDLVIFDRYRLRGVLGDRHLLAIRDYVAAGGALLMASGPEFAGAQSLAHSPLADLLPALPAGRAVERAFRVRLTAVGRRHPVTAPLTRGTDTAAPSWAPWYRYLPVRLRRGAVLLSGPEGGPLLILAAAEKGRVAMLQSDQFWLWARGFAGGGPYVPLLRRTIHWLMKEPDLEAESLNAAIGDDGRLIITRRSLAPGVKTVTIAGPDGATHRLEIKVGDDGLGRQSLSDLPPGRYRLREDGLARVVVVPDPDAREFDEVVPTQDRLAPLVSRLGGRIYWLADGVPGIIHGRAQAGTPGRALILPRRDIRRTVSMSSSPLAPVWAWAFGALMPLLLGWLLGGGRPWGPSQESRAGRKAKVSGKAGASGTKG